MKRLPKGTYLAKIISFKCNASQITILLFTKFQVKKKSYFIIKLNIIFQCFVVKLNILDYKNKN